MTTGKIMNLGNIDQVSIGHGHCFVVGEKEVAVFRSREEKLFAIENICPHRQGPLADGIIGDGKVVCPLHGHKFDLSTGEGSEEGECVTAFEIWEDQGNILIKM